ncbi:MAG: CoA transferase [Dehalococcoidia bacterium]|nr:CoA transferase [Dehalococcoidia bacterium]
MTTGDAGTPRALDDLRVLDLTDRLGQYCGRMLASLGADVIRIEPPGGLDGRRVHPLAGGEPDGESSLDFWFHSLRQRSVVLDLDTAEGQAALTKLARGADVLIESATPGVMAARGLDYAALSAANPALIYTSVTPFGQEGPYSRWAATDITLMGLGGQMWLCGYADAPPARLAGSQAFIQGALHSLYATLIALYHRDITGEGQHIDVSAQACIATAQETAMQFWDLRRELRTRTGAERRSPGAGPYPCADGVVQWMAPATANGWTNLVQWMRDDGVEGDYWTEEWVDGMYRVKHLDEFDSWFIPWVTEKTKDELDTGAQKYHLTIGPVRNVDEIVANDHLAVRDYWTEVEAPASGARYRLPGVPMRMSETPLLAGGRPPTLGEDSDEVLAEPERTAGGRIVDGANGAGSQRMALEGVRIIDFSWFGAGPMGTKVLADHGAEVIRVESEYRLDGLRRAGPKREGQDGPNHSGYYNGHNSSKLSTRINVNDPQGAELVKRLVAIADVVIDNFNPGVMAKWGLSYAELRAIKDDIIVVNMPMMGLTGPRKDDVGFGSTMVATTGLSALTGFPEQMPAGVGTNYPDYSCNPYHTMSGMLAALHHRNRTGQSQHIELAQFESTLQMIGPAILDYTVNGVVPPRPGNRDPLIAPHAAFQAAGPPTAVGEDDRWIAIACPSDDDWAALVAEMGSPQWATEPALASFEGRKAAEDELERRVGEWVRTQDGYELMERLQARGVPAGVVQNASDVLERDPQLAVREHFQRLMHPEAGEAAYDSPPVKLSRTPGELRAPAPCLGQHNEQVLQGILGLTDDEYREYEDANVFF